MDERVLDKLKYSLNQRNMMYPVHLAEPLVLTKKGKSGVLKDGVYAIVLRKTDAVSLY